MCLVYLLRALALLLLLVVGLYAGLGFVPVLCCALWMLVREVGLHLIDYAPKPPYSRWDIGFSLFLVVLEWSVTGGLFWWVFATLSACGNMPCPAS
jgi:hypothetical protein